MCITEIRHEIHVDIISINKTVTEESKQTKAKTLIFVVALKGAI